MRRWAWIGGLCCAAAFGCAGSKIRKTAELPEAAEVRREQLIVHSNFRIPEHHRLLDELAELRADVATTLSLPLSEEPIHIYLFETAAQYSEFITEDLPHMPERRACFVERGNKLAVYSHWSDFVAIDLRHEVTHGCLHGVLPSIPLWLDEGLAEYFEVGRGVERIHRSHLRLLQRHRQEHNWRPDVKKLEQLRLPGEMGQLHYAESWAWIHFLLETPARRKLLEDHLEQLRSTGEREPLSEAIRAEIPDAEVQLLKHLRSLGDGARL